MNDALGGAQSVLVLGGGSEIALATVRKLIEGRCRTVDARRPRHRSARPAGQGARGRRRDHRRRRRVRRARLRVARRRSSATCSREHADFDLVLLAFGVLGDQDLAETDGAEARRIVESNFTGAVSVLVPLVGALKDAGPRHGRRAVVRRRRARPQVELRLRVEQGGPRRVLPGPRRQPRRHRRAHRRRAARLRAHEDDRGAGRRAARRPTPTRSPTRSSPGSAAAPRRSGSRRRCAIVMSVLRHVPRPVFRRLPL